MQMKGDNSGYIGPILISLFRWTSFTSSPEFLLQQKVKYHKQCKRCMGGSFVPQEGDLWHQASIGFLSLMRGKARSCFSFMHCEFVNPTCKNTVLLNLFSANTKLCALCGNLIVYYNLVLKLETFLCRVCFMGQCTKFFRNRRHQGNSPNNPCMHAHRFT